MAFRFFKNEIPDVLEIESDVYRDSRGYFTEVYKFPEFQQNGILKPFVQVNHSHSSQDTLRGLHYQKHPAAQGKMVSVVEGKIFDVAVDLRSGSPYFGRWVAKYLNSEQKKMLYIPEGFAHGFCVLSKRAQVIYYCTEVYTPEEERGILWNDPDLAITWPVRKPVLSEKDSQYPRLKEADCNFSYGARVDSHAQQ